MFRVIRSLLKRGQRRLHVVSPCASYPTFDWVIAYSFHQPIESASRICHVEELGLAVLAVGATSSVFRLDGGIDLQTAAGCIPAVWFFPLFLDL